MAGDLGGCGNENSCAERDEAGDFGIHFTGEQIQMRTQLGRLSLGHALDL